MKLNTTLTPPRHVERQCPQCNEYTPSNGTLHAECEHCQLPIVATTRNNEIEDDWQWEPNEQ